MKALWIGLVVGQTLSRWGTILLGQEDILCAFLKKMKATTILNEEHRK